MNRPLVSLRFWSLAGLGAFVVGAADLLSTGIGSCSNREVTHIDQALVIGSALVFTVSAIAVLVGVLMNLVVRIRKRSSVEPGV